VNQLNSELILCALWVETDIGAMIWSSIIKCMVCYLQQSCTADKAC